MPAADWPQQIRPVQIGGASACPYIAPAGDPEPGDEAARHRDSSRTHSFIGAPDGPHDVNSDRPLSSQVQAREFNRAAHVLTASLNF